MNQYPHLFSPYKIRNTTFRNRILSAPLGSPTFWIAGFPSAEGVAQYAAQAAGGAASITLPEVYVDTNYRRMIWGFETTNPDAVLGLRMLSNAIRRHGAVASFELNHLGADSVPRDADSAPPAGPSAYIRGDGVSVVQMTGEMIEEAAAKFAHVAYLCKQGGFDMVMLHAGHGWLIHQFMSPQLNHRTDKFGGSVENRARFPIMILDKIRERCGRDFLIEFRVSGNDHTPGGMLPEDVIEIVKLFEDKIDILHVSTGIHSDESTVMYMFPTTLSPHAINVETAAIIKKALNVPVTVVGAINDPETAERILAEGKTDFVSIGRGLLADPDFARKARAGRADEIIPCIRCRECHWGLETSEFNCTVNPATSNLAYLASVPPVRHPKKVAVIGGGPGGMQAAIAASERGHQVTLYEKEDRLGGILDFTDRDEIKGDLKAFKDSLIARLGRLDVDVRLNTSATPEMVAKYAPDAVIAAVGADAAIPGIKGIDRAVHALQIYRGNFTVGGRVVIIGGGLTGCETGLHLAKQNKDVTVLEMQDNFATERCMYRVSVVELLEELKDRIKIVTSMICTEVTSDGVRAIDKTGKDIFFLADTVVYAAGMKAREALAETFREVAPLYYAVGDCVKPGKVQQAVHEGFFAAWDI